MEKIAERLQYTNVSSHSVNNFDINLKLLKKLLSDLDICLDDKERNPKYTNQIGLATLLDNIYNTNGYWGISKLDFREYICKLEALGVKNLKFNPISFPTQINKKLGYEKNDTYMGIGHSISKCYTDGKFKLYRPKAIISYKDYDRYEMKDIEKASFILYTNINHNAPYAYTEPLVKESNIVVNNFNGKLPVPNELFKIEFPKLKSYSSKIEWGESPNYTQIYNEFTHNEYVKKLTK